MKAIMTAVLMMSFFSVAGASVPKKSTKAPARIETSAKETCHLRSAKGLQKAKPSYAHLLNEAPTSKQAPKKSAPAKGVDSKRG